MPVRVAVTGHRDLIAADETLVRALVRHALEYIGELYAGGRADHLELLSGLAPGGDLLVAEVARELGISVQPLLPEPADVYTADRSGTSTFDPPDAAACFATPIDHADARRRVVAWLAEPGSRPAQVVGGGESSPASADAQTLAYVRLADRLATDADILIALWDGLDNGRPGGTADVVRRAVRATPERARRARRLQARFGWERLPPIYQLVVPRASNPHPLGVPYQWHEHAVDYPAPRSHLAPTVRMVAPYVLPTLAVAAVALGTVGIHVSVPTVSWHEAFFRAAGYPLLSGFEASHPNGWLDVARSLGVLFIVAGAATVVLRTLAAWRRRHVLRLRVLWHRRDAAMTALHLRRRPTRDVDAVTPSSGHVAVVCGLGVRGRTVVGELRRAGWLVVAVDLDPAGAVVDEARVIGVGVVPGDATDPDVLRTAGVERANAVYVMMPDDVALAVLARVLPLAGRRLRAGRTCQVIATIASAQTREVAQALARETALEAPAVQLRCVDTAAAAARRLLRDYPVGRFVPVLPGTVPPRRAHVLVLGWSAIAEAIVLHVLRSAQFPDERRAAVTVAARDHARIADAFLARYPAADPCAFADDPLLAAVRDDVLAPLRFVELPRSVSALHDDAFPLWASLDAGAVVTVYVCEPSAVASVELVAALGPRMALYRAGARGAGHAPVDCQLFYQSDEPSDGRGDVHAAMDEAFNRQLPVLPIQPFRSVGGEATAALHDVVSERRAEWIHARFRERNPELDDWAHLDEVSRESSRAVADHLDEKLRAAGLFRTYAATRGLAGGAAAGSAADAVPDSELASARPMLAALEHRRWCAERLLAGFRRSTLSFTMWRVDPALKRAEQVRHRHVDLVPFAGAHGLDAGEREKVYDVTAMSTRMLWESSHEIALPRPRAP